MLTAREQIQGVIDELKKVMPRGSPLLATLSDGVSRLTLENETLKFANTLDAESGGAIPDIGLTPHEKGIIRLLRGKGAVGATHYGILASLYSGVPDNSWPEIKIINVFVSKMRAKYFAAKLCNPIRTIYATGYAIAEWPAGTDYATTYPDYFSDREMVKAYQAPKPPIKRTGGRPKNEFTLAAEARKAHGVWKPKPKESIAA